MGDKKTPAENLKAAKEERAASLVRLQAFATKMGTAEWKEDTDGPAYEAEKRSYNDLASKVSRMEEVASLTTEARAADWTQTSGIPTAAPANGPITVNVITDPKKDTHTEARSRYSLMAAVAGAMKGRVTGLEAEMHQEAETEMRALGQAGLGTLYIPSFLMAQVPQPWATEKRDVTSSVLPDGGYMVDTKLGDLIEFLRPRLTVQDMGATYMANQTSNLSFPRNTVAMAATWAATENATAQETTPTFDLLELKPKRLTAYTDVSRINMVQVNNLSMENWIRKQLNKSVMQALDLASLNGTGLNGQPMGILNTVGVGDITIGANGGLLDWKKVVQFETLCAAENADDGALGYLATSGVAGFLKTEKRDTAGNGFIWEGPNRDALVNGYKAMTSNLLPSTLTKGTAAGILHAMVFGNWSELIIAQWGGLDILVNPYTKGKESLVELIIHSFYDLGVRHAKSFVKCDEIAIA